MKKKHDIIEKLIPILSRYEIKKAAVFGSYARGDYTDRSDFDLVIDMSYDENHSLVDTFYGFWDDAETALGLNLDLLSFQSLQESTKHKFKQNVYSEMEWFYEA